MPDHLSRRRTPKHQKPVVSRAFHLNFRLAQRAVHSDRSPHPHMDSVWLSYP
jgi:hypothetical protein